MKERGKLAAASAPAHCLKDACRAAQPVRHLHIRKHHLTELEIFLRADLGHVADTRSQTNISY